VIYSFYGKRREILWEKAARKKKKSRIAGNRSGSG